MPRSRISGALVALFTIEQIVNGWRNGFVNTRHPTKKERIAVTTHGLLIVVMGFLFLFLGYRGFRSLSR